VTLLASLQAELERHLARIERLFTADVRLTLLARKPGHDEADVLLTRDGLGDVAAAVDRAKRRAGESEPLYLIVFRADDGPVQAIFESASTARDRYDRMRQSWSDVFLCRVEDGPRDVIEEQRRLLATATESTVAAEPITMEDLRKAMEALPDRRDPQ
jgi:hypothetical protein